MSFKEYLKEKLLLENTKIKKVPDNSESFEGKTDPTQYDNDNKVILVKQSYDTKKDIEGWMVHEQKHADLDKKGFKDDGKEYPYNNTEMEAYIAQFKALKKRGIKDFEELKDNKKFPTLSIKITKNNGSNEKILMKYWKNA